MKHLTRHVTQFDAFLCALSLFRKLVKKAVAVKTKTDQASEFLDNMKNRETIVEEQLAKVLLEKHKFGDSFTNAGQLLGQVKLKLKFN